MLRAVDSDSDGKISLAEWDVAMEQMREARVEGMLTRQGAKEGKVAKDQARGRLKRNFEAWDLNKDGFVDRSELHQAFGGAKVKEVKPAAATEK